MDRRYHELAQMLLHHSLRVRAGERVLIRFDTLGASFAETLGQEVLRAGCHPVFAYSSPGVWAVRLTEGTAAQMRFLHPSELVQTECDCQVLLEAPGPALDVAVSPARLAQRREATSQWRQRIEQIRYVIAAVPTPYLAERLGMRYPDCEALLLKAATGVNWRRLVYEARRIRQRLASGSMVRILARGTDLRFRLDGRKGVIAHGRRNLPDGELYFAPIEESVSGCLQIPGPQFWAGERISGIRLEIRQGEVIAADAQSGLNHLRALLATDPGARRIGEFGIGLNPMIQTLTGHALLDEKVAGTVHLALGSAPAATDGKNRSGVHWDMVLDLRHGGRVLLDGRLICRDGRWLFPVGAEHRAVCD